MERKVKIILKIIYLFCEHIGSLTIFVEGSKKKPDAQSAPKTVRRCGLTAKNGQTFGADRMATKIVRQSAHFNPNFEPF